MPALLGETWEWNGAAGTWSQVAIGGPAPSPRELSGMSYNPTTQSTLLVGGNSVVGGPGAAASAETWTWNGVAWSEVTTSGAPPVGAATLVHDPATSTMLLVTSRNKTWRYTGQTWTELTTTGSPSGNLGNIANFPGRNVLTIQGPSGVHEWGGGTWSPSIGPLQAPVSPDRMTYDAMRGRLVAVGAGGGGIWEWDGAAWERRLAGQTTAGAALAYDSVRRVTLQFGGRRSGSDVSEFHQWDGTALTSIVTSVLPSARREHRMVFNPKTGRVVLFGGLVSENPSRETWLWDGTAWSLLSVIGSPAGGSARPRADPERDRVVLFGGNGNPPGTPMYLDDTWEWDGTTWTQLQPMVRPVARAGHLLAYDPRRQRVVLAGGNAAAGPLADTWEWDGTAWTERTTVVSVPFWIGRGGAGRQRGHRHRWSNPNGAPSLRVERAPGPVRERRYRRRWPRRLRRSRLLGALRAVVLARTVRSDDRALRRRRVRSADRDLRDLPRRLPAAIAVVAHFQSTACRSDGSCVRRFATVAPSSVAITTPSPSARSATIVPHGSTTSVWP